MGGQKIYVKFINLTCHSSGEALAPGCLEIQPKFKMMSSFSEQILSQIEYFKSESIFDQDLLPT